MHSHAGAATQQTQLSSVSPLQILPFCKKIIQPTALLSQPLARPLWLCWNKLCHTSCTFATAELWLCHRETQSHCWHLKDCAKTGTDPWGSGGRGAHTQTRLTGLLHLSKAKVSPRTQASSISTSIQLHTSCSQKQTHWCLSDLLLVTSPWKSTERLLICFHQVPKFPIFQVKYRECQEGSRAKDHTYSYLMMCGQ